MWLRLYPTHEVLGFLFGVDPTTVSRLLQRVMPVLAQAGKDTMRMPDPGRKHRRHFDELLRDLPEFAVVIDSFEQRVQRPQGPHPTNRKSREAADRWYSGKKKMHTIKSQVGVDVHNGYICDVSDSARGPTADITLLKQSGLMQRLTLTKQTQQVGEVGEVGEVGQVGEVGEVGQVGEVGEVGQVGGEGDLAYVGIGELHPQGSRYGNTPRRKPRGADKHRPRGQDKPRPPQDIAYNKAFAKRRVVVENTLCRLRTYQAITQTDRTHRKMHTERVQAIAGLVNRKMQHRLPFLFI
jgi:hypothetical protein